MNEHLMTAVLYSAVFFETSGEDECDPDVAVNKLEQLAYFLRQLPREEQNEQRRHGHRLAADQPDPLMADQVRAVVDALLPSAVG